MVKSKGCDPISEFCAAMFRSGITPPAEVRDDGNIHRFPTDGDHGGERAGWYVLHSTNSLVDVPHGAFGDWRAGVSKTWSARSESYTRQEPNALATARRAAQEARSFEEAAAAENARRLWDEASSADASHPYLISKFLPPLTLRVHRGALLVPLSNLDGKVLSIQRIFPDGKKSFFKGARVSGLCSVLGSLDRVTQVIICEGWATGATLYLPNYVPVLAAMTAGNLIHVAKAARRRWPTADIVIAGDDDRFTEGNPGRTAAMAAASATGSRLALPPFDESDLAGTDFNDLLVARLRRGN